MQRQERLDLVKEMKDLLLWIFGKHFSKRDGFINGVLPIEILKKILERLDCKSLCFAKQTSRLWKEIIEEFQLVEKAASKFL